MGRDRRSGPAGTHSRCRARKGQEGPAEGNRALVGACWLPSSAEQPSPGQNASKVCPPPCVPEQGEEERQWPQDLQPPPPPGPQKDGQEERAGGEERPATEPLFKALDTPLSEGDEPTTLPAPRDHGHSVQMEGYLGRKHDLEGPNKKASNRCVAERRRWEEAWATQVCARGEGALYLRSGVLLGAPLTPGMWGKPVFSSGPQFKSCDLGQVIQPKLVSPSVR